MKRPLRIANFSGFFGDRDSALAEILRSENLDVVTGDYLSEVTMMILAKQQKRDSSLGYAASFLTHLGPHLEELLNRHIRVVVNAGGLNPDGLAAAVLDASKGIERKPKIAVVKGDDLRTDVERWTSSGKSPIRHLETNEVLPLDQPLVAVNAYLGGWGITAALTAGADIVITGRVTDASLVSGAAAWWHDWKTDDYQQLAGAVVAGHVLECGPQATGGNFSGFREIDSSKLPSFPIAEIDHAGASLITKAPGTGGAVTIDTITSQLLYEVISPAYLNPDVIARFDTVQLEQIDRHSVRLSGTHGAAPTDKLKVSVVRGGYYRNTMVIAVTGLYLREKVALLDRAIRHRLSSSEQIHDLDIRLLGAKPEKNPATQEEATRYLRICAVGTKEAVGRPFAQAITELATASIPGFYSTTPPTKAQETGSFWPGLLSTDLVQHQMVDPHGRTHEILPKHTQQAEMSWSPGHTKIAASRDGLGDGIVAPLGAFVHARSGDKGGDANLGLWVHTDEAYEWLLREVTAEVIPRLVPDAAGLSVHRYEFPNLRGVNFHITGLLSEGATTSTRPDVQAKALGEFIRARELEIPAKILENARF